MPQVSIIVPVYNVEKYLRRCLDSVLNQTLPSWEVIAVDDGSPDNSGAICEEYATNDRRIHVIHQKNGGLSAARNTGIQWALQNSDSIYLTFLDSDDWLHPQFLEILVTSLEKNSAQVSMAGIVNVTAYSDEFHETILSPKTEVFGPEALFINRQWDFNYACGKLYRKADFIEVRYPNGKVFEDVFTTYRIIFAVEKVAVVKPGLYYYFYNQEGISHSPWNPRELVIFEGMRQQLDFYKKNGYARAYKKEHRLYLNHFAYQITRIRSNKADFEKNKHYIPALRREMMSIIRESNGKYNRKNMPQCYAAAYPKLTECRRLASAVVRTLKKDGFSTLFKKFRDAIHRQ